MPEQLFPTEWAPRYILHSDDKKRARLNCLAHVLKLIRYKKVPCTKVKPCPSAR